MHRKRLVVALSCLFAIGVVHAAKSPLSGADCALQDTQMDMNACAFQAFEKQDRELNALYGQLVKQEDHEAVRQLQAAQRAWLQFRDLECVYETPDAGGSLAPMETASCKEALTRARILDLKRMLRQQVH